MSTDILWGEANAALRKRAIVYPLKGMGEWGYTEVVSQWNLHDPYLGCVKI